MSSLSLRQGTAVQEADAEEIILDTGDLLQLQHKQYDEALLDDYSYYNPYSADIPPDKLPKGNTNAAAPDNNLFAAGAGLMGPGDSGSITDINVPPSLTFSNDESLSMFDLQSTYGSPSPYGLPFPESEDSSLLDNGEALF